MVAGSTMPAQPSDAEWVLPKAAGAEPRWGLNAGLQFAIPPAPKGPRGLIRIFYPTLPDGGSDLINFIAIEPIVNKRRGYSELEHSRLDAVPGLRLTADAAVIEQSTGNLRVTIHCERFANGAHVRLVMSQHKDAPGEIAFTIHAEADSEPMAACILTSTMSNKARNRILWLHNAQISSLERFAEYHGKAFTPPAVFPLARLLRNAAGDVVVAVTTDEKNPAAVHPFTSSLFYYGGFPVTQYWRKPRGGVHADLTAVVNARYTYWQTERPIPGGIAFENFELHEPFHDGESFIFGITPRLPQELATK